jgi:hypothetical protein
MIGQTNVPLSPKQIRVRLEAAGFSPFVTHANATARHVNVRQSISGFGGFGAGPVAQVPQHAATFALFQLGT